MLHIVFFGANYNLLTAAQQAEAVGWFFPSPPASLRALFRVNHQLLFTLGWLKSAAAVICWQLLTLNPLTNWQLCEYNERRSRGKQRVRNIANIIFSDCSRAQHLSPQRAAWMWTDQPWALFVYPGSLAPVGRVIYMHFTALCFTLCTQISLATTFLLICWKFSVDW